MEENKNIAEKRQSPIDEADSEKDGTDTPLIICFNEKCLKKINQCFQ